MTLQMTLHLIAVTFGFVWGVGAIILWLVAIPQAWRDGGVIEILSRGVIAALWPVFYLPLWLLGG